MKNKILMIILMTQSVSAVTCFNDEKEITISSSVNSDTIVLIDEILIPSGLCKKLSSFTGVSNPFGETLVCAGELFAPAVYGQVIMTNGSIEALVNTIAPRTDWECKF